jgi:erythronate-4-phosphate dehydrogenase
MKIVADQQIPHVVQAFSEFAEVTLCNGREINAEKIHDADVLLLRSVTTVNADLLEDSQVRFVASATSGLDHIDQDYLHKNKIGFAHARGSNARSVAEYVLSSLFVLADQHDIKFKDKTVGVIGYGEVGSRVVELLKTLDVKTIINDPPLKDAPEKDESGDVNYRDVHEIFSADIITLHVPLTSDGPYPTQNLLDAQFLSQLNDDVILLNTARGGVINEAALKNRLACHKDMKVVLDVWENEPDIDLELLSEIDIGTPHIAGYSTDGKIHATEMIFELLCEFFKLDYKWNPVFELAVANSLELPLGAELDDQDAIQMAILASYDVRGDSASLRQLSGISTEQRGQYFDELRKNYPVRREFPATAVHLPEGRKTLAGKLKQLGFKVKVFS